MNQSEAVAMKWIAKHLRSHVCRVCGRQWITGQSVGVIFHNCQPSGRGYDWRSPRQRVDDEREDWARSLFGDALADAVDEDDQLRRL